MKAMHLRSHLPANHRLKAVDIKEDVIYPDRNFVFRLHPVDLDVVC